MPSKTAPVFQLKISINGIRPPVWRRVLVPGNYRLDRLHSIIQTAMGWQDYHLHEFQIDGLPYGDLSQEPPEDYELYAERGVQLQELLVKPRQRFTYLYDFGDDWIHTIQVEEILPPDPALRHPACLAGARACPPEDVGGVHGYAEFLKAIRSPRHPEYDSYLEWIGGEFDPEAFDLQTINRRLRLRRRSPLRQPDDSPAADLLDPAEVAWIENFRKAHQAAATDLPLRRDMRTFLNYLQANKVVGTKATGNLPLKVAEALCAALVEPVPFGQTFGKRTFKPRSASEIMPLVVLQTLASAASLIDSGAGQPWTVTAMGERYLQIPESMQVWLLILTWWGEADWSVVYPNLPPGFFDRTLKLLTLHQLLDLPEDGPFPFDDFADQFVAVSGLKVQGALEEYQRGLTHGMLSAVVARPLRDQGILELTFQPHPILGENSLELATLQLTPMGRIALVHLLGSIAPTA